MISFNGAKDVLDVTESNPAEWFCRENAETVLQRKKFARNCIAGKKSSDPCFEDH